MVEKRKEPRQRTFLKGRIVFNNGASSMDCLVRDMSSTGARLALTETATLPEVFDLYVAQKERTYRASLRWRRSDGIGIAFVEEGAVAPPAPTPAPAPPAEDQSASFLALVRRISELEAENAALRRLIASPPPARDLA